MLAFYINHKCSRRLTMVFLRCQFQLLHVPSLTGTIYILVYLYAIFWRTNNSILQNINVRCLKVYPVKVEQDSMGVLFSSSDKNSTTPLFYGESHVIILNFNLNWKVIKDRYSIILCTFKRTLHFPQLFLSWFYNHL